MFQSYFHICLWSIRAINITWCQKCFKSEMDPRVHIHIHPSNFQRREGEKSKHSSLQGTYTQGTLLLSSIPDHKQQHSIEYQSIIHSTTNHVKRTFRSWSLHELDQRQQSLRKIPEMEVLCRRHLLQHTIQRIRSRKVCISSHLDWRRWIPIPEEVESYRQTQV